MTNKEYLSDLRKRSCYPTFRSFVGLGLVIGYLLAIAVFIAGIMGKGMWGIVAGIVIAALTKTWQEISLMVADLADSSIDNAAQNNRS